MKNVIIFLISIISYSGIAQSKYEDGMQKALDLWGADKPWKAVNLFERIASAEPDEWLPPYYAACYPKTFLLKMGKALYVHARLFYSTTHYLKNSLLFPPHSIHPELHES